MKTTLSILVSLVLVPVAFAADDTHFDGTWDTVISCENAGGALGYSFKFPSVVKDSVLLGSKGTKGKPGYLQVYGKISSDGSAKLYADGLIGASEVAVGHRPVGTQYGYHIEANFMDTSGTGKRVEGRPCSVTFTKADKH
jgi:hypothetical protein